jgi:glutathionyl-hydroquinone reductase
MTPIDVDPAQLRIVIDELADALIRAVALGGYALQGTATDAEALNASIRRATAALQGLQLGVRISTRGRR